LPPVGAALSPRQQRDRRRRSVPCAARGLLDPERPRAARAVRRAPPEAAPGALAVHGQRERGERLRDRAAVARDDPRDPLCAPPRRTGQPVFSALRPAPAHRPAARAPGIYYL